MSGQTPPPRRRRIAGESATPAAKPKAAKPVARKQAPATKTRSKVGEAVAAQRSSSTAAPARPTIAAKSSVAVSSSSSSGDGSIRGLIAAVVAGVVLVAGATTAVLGFKHWQGDSFADSRESATSAASDAAETILSYTYDNLDAHNTSAKALMTKDYAAEYEKTTVPALEDLAPQRKVAVKAVVRNAGPVPCGETCSPDKATILLFVDLDRRLEGDDTVTLFGNRILVDVVRSGGDWKVANVRGL